MNALGGLLQALLLLGSLILVIAALAASASRWPVVGFFVFGMLTLAEQWRQSVVEAGALRLGAQVGSMWVSVLDIATVVLVFAGLLLLGRTGSVGLDRSGQAAVALTCLTIVGVGHWVATEGLEAGVNAWRSWFYGLALFWWGYLALRSRAPGLRTALVALGLAAAVAQAFGYLSAGFAPFSSGVLIEGEYFDPRPIHAQSALLMVAAVAVLLNDGALRRSTRLVLTGVLVVSIVLSMHRSVWVALALVLLVELVRADDAGARRLFSRPVVVTLLVVAAPVAVVVFRATTALSEASTDTGNLLWRQALWLERLDRPRSLAEWMLGGVAVPDSARDLGSFAGTGHNMYVDVLDRFGLVGILLLGVLVTAALRYAGRSDASMLRILVALLGFGLFYPWPIWSWVILGAAGQQQIRVSRSSSLALNPGRGISHARALGAAPE